MTNVSKLKGVPRVGTQYVGSSDGIDWRLKAACRDWNPEMWEAGGFDQLPKLERAKRICASCPVTLQCKRSATKADLEYSMRAGMMPRMQPRRPSGRPTKAKVLTPKRVKAEPKLAEGKCLRDHEIKVPEDLNKRGYCRKCAVAVSMERRRANGGQPRGSRTHCSRGHEFTPENTLRCPSAPENRRCRECEKRRKANKRARDREALAQAG